MDTIASNPAFGTWALCTAILAFKMILSAFYTAGCRLRNRGFVNPEDAAAFGAGSPPGEQEHPAVAHALRIQRNDLENIPPFFAVSLAYVLLGATPFGAAVYLGTFTAARVLHTLVYMAHLQPWRALCFAVGVFCMLGMISVIVKQTV